MKAPTTVNELPLIVERDGVTTVTPPVYAQERVIVVGGETRTCETCKHWTGEDSIRWALCHASTEDTFPVLNELWTAPEFGCNQWQPREAQPRDG